MQLSALERGIKASDTHFLCTRARGQSGSWLSSDKRTPTGARLQSEGKNCQISPSLDCRVKSWSSLVHFCGIFLCSAFLFITKRTLCFIFSLSLCCVVMSVVGEMCDKSFTVQKSIPLSVMNKDALMWRTPSRPSEARLWFGNCRPFSDCSALSEHGQWYIGSQRRY